MVDLDPILETYTLDLIEFGNHLDAQNYILDDPVENIDEDVVDDIDEPAAPLLRRSSGQCLPSTHYLSDEYILLIDREEPQCYKEAMENKHNKEWVITMDDEIKSLVDNHTFELVKLLKDKKALQNRWIYRLKVEENSFVPQ